MGYSNDESNEEPDEEHGAFRRIGGDSSAQDQHSKSVDGNTLSLVLNIVVIDQGDRNIQETWRDREEIRTLSIL